MGYSGKGNIEAKANALKEALDKCEEWTAEDGQIEYRISAWKWDGEEYRPEVYAESEDEAEIAELFERAKISNDTPQYNFYRSDDGIDTLLAVKDNFGTQRYAHRTQNSRFEKG